jgi:hypothetical protein
MPHVLSLIVCNVMRRDSNSEDTPSLLAGFPGFQHISDRIFRGTNCFFDQNPFASALHGRKSATKAPEGGLGMRALPAKEDSV